MQNSKNSQVHSVQFTPGSLILRHTNRLNNASGREERLTPVVVVADVLRRNAAIAATYCYCYGKKRRKETDAARALPVWNSRPGLPSTSGQLFALLQRPRSLFTLPFPSLLIFLYLAAFACSVLHFLSDLALAGSSGASGAGYSFITVFSQTHFERSITSVQIFWICCTDYLQRSIIGLLLATSRAVEEEPA